MKAPNVTEGDWIACKTLYCGKVVDFHITGTYGSSKPIADCSYRLKFNSEELAANAEMLAASKKLAEELCDAYTQHRCGCAHPACNQCHRDSQIKAVLISAGYTEE